MKKKKIHSFYDNRFTDSVRFRTGIMGQVTPVHTTEHLALPGKDVITISVLPDTLKLWSSSTSTVNLANETQT